MTDIIEKARKYFKNDKAAWSNIYSKASDDLHFLSDDPNAQWDEKDYKARVSTGRPALTIDQLGQFIHQVANDIRMNTPTINVLPSDAESSEAVAEIYKGLIKEIEYRSAADDVYDTASLSAIRCGIGFIRIDHEYDGDSFEQRLVIKRVVNPLAVWLDSDSIECDGRDAKRAIIIDEMSVDEFKDKYPKFEPACFEQYDAKTAKKLSGADKITIAEVFMVEETTETITSEDGKQKRETTKRTVRRYKMSGKDILEETTFPSRYIPIVPVYGEEAWVDGERQIYSLIRKSKSAQRMFNYWKSLETELLMKAPQAPVMAVEGQVEDYADDWKNPSKSMVLRYKGKDDQGQPLPPPQRLEPPTIPTGIVNAARQTVDDIKATMGIYNAGLGMMDNAVSGVAITGRKQEGDVATYHFADNLVRSITHVGRILVDAIPVVYDTPRILRIVGAEDDTKIIGVNGALVLDQPQSIDLTKGKFDVRVVTGASSTTKRQEAAQFLSTLVQSDPSFIKIVGDLLFKNMDIAGAHAISERIKKVMDPAVIGEEGQDPAVMQMQAQLQQMQQMVAGLQAQLQSKEAELQLKAQAEQNDAQESQAKVQVQLMELQLKQQQFEAETALERARLELQARELALKEKELQAGALQSMASNQGGVAFPMEMSE